MKPRIYKPVLFRRYQLLALMYRGLARLMNLWPIIALCWFVFVSLGVHVLVKGTIQGTSNRRVHCEYIGINGRIEMPQRSYCQLIVMMKDKRK